MAQEISYEDAAKTAPAEVTYEQAAGLPPAKPRGMVSAFGAGVKETVGQAAQAAGSITGLSGAEQWGKEVRAGAAPTETEGTGASIARAAGNLVGWLPAIAGTLAVLPETPEALVGGAAIRGMAGMLAPAAATKVTTTSDLKDKGVDDATAQNAGWAAAATTAASGAIPLSLTGNLLTRAASGAVSGLAVGEVSRESQNAILSGHPELQQGLNATDAVASGVIGAMLGGIMGPRPLKTAISDAHSQAAADFAQGAPLALPNPNAPIGSPTGITGRTMISFADGSAGTKEDFDAHINSLPPEQQASERARMLIGARQAPFELTPPGETPAAVVADKTEPAAPQAAPGQQQLPFPVDLTGADLSHLDTATNTQLADKLVAARKAADIDRAYAQYEGDKDTQKSIESARAWNLKYAADQADAVASGKELAPALPTRDALEGIAASVKEPNAKIPRQLLSQLWQGTKSAEDLATKLRAKADEYDAAGIRTTDAGTLHAVADHIFPKGDTNAVPIESPSGVLQQPQKGAGEAGSERQRVEPVQQGAEVTPEKGNGSETQQVVTEKALNEEAAKTEPSKAQQQKAPASEPAPSTVNKPKAADTLGRNIPKDQAKIASEISALHVEANRLYEAGDIAGAQRTAHRAIVKTIEAGPEYHQHLLDEQAKNASEAFESKTSGQAANPATKAEIHAEATKLFGSKEAADRLVVHVTDPEKQIPKRALDDLRRMQKLEERAITVAFAHNGKVYVMDNMVEKGNERAIILHEAGVHLGMENLIGKVNFAKLTEQIRDWAMGNGAEADVALARKAMESVRDAGAPESHMDQETVAYFVQHAVESGINPTHIEGATQSKAAQWMRKIWSAMTTALQKLGIDPSSLRAQDIVDIAHAAAVSHGASTPPAASPEVQRSARSVDFQSGPRQAANAVDAVVSKAMNIWDGMKPAIQRAHWNWSQMTHIADMTEHLIPMLPQWGKDAVSPIRDKVNSMLASGAIAKELNHAAQGIYDRMQALPPKQKEALVQLMGKYQLAKVFPNLSLDAHTWLKPEEAKLYREARQLYAQPGVAAAYDAARLHNQRLHDTGMASMLKSMGQIYGVPEHLWRAINVRDGMSKEVTALLDHVKASDNHDLQDQFNTAMNLHEAKKTESYFSLGRDGDYMVNFRIKDTPEAHAAVQKALSASGVKDSIVVNPGDTHVFSMFETMNQMLTVTKELDKIRQHLEPKEGTDAAGLPTSSPYTAGLAVEKLKTLDSSAPSFIRGMLAKIDADPHLNVEQKAEQQELLRRMYINMLPESSVSKFYARRAGTPGYSSDMARSFVKRSIAGAFFTAQHATRPEQNVAMARLREATSALGDAGSPHFDLKKQTEAVNVLNELNKRTANQLTPLHTPMIDAASAMGHAFYLSASPSFILQNLAQPYQLTLPYLGGRHGFRASSVAMGAAARDVAKILKDTIQQGWQNNKWTGVLDATITVDRAEHLGAGDKDALKHLIASGRADWTQGGQLTHIAEGSSRALETALKTANSVSYYGEVLNRMQTGLAAYRLEMKRSGDTAKALDYMVRAVDDTQINYATENKARAMGKHGVFGQITPMVLAFQQFNLGVMQLLGKLVMQATSSGLPAAERMEAVKSLGGIMTATSVAAGTLGLPFVGAVMGAYNSLMGSENSPVDAKSDYQNYLSDIMGHDAAQVVAHGAINYLTGADVASKLGQENLIPFTQLFSQLMDDRQPLRDRLNAGALSFMGPVINGGSSILQGMGKIADGDTMKGLAQMSPAMTKGLIKSVDLAENGFTSAKGVQLPMEATTWDTMVQAAGFTPAKLATQREAQSGVSAIQTALKMRQTELAKQFIDAVNAHDPIARMRVMDEAREFMRENPGLHVDFAGAMRKRAQDEAIAKVTGGVQAKSSQIPMVIQQSRFAQGL
ncbi:MAG: PLxRFG domain-containing protein [Bellilinea sp.]